MAVEEGYGHSILGGVMKSKTFALLVGLLVLAALGVTSMFGHQSVTTRKRLLNGRPARFRIAGQRRPLYPQFVPNKVLIQLRTNTGGEVKVAIRSRIDALRFETVSLTSQGELVLVDLPQDESVDSAIARLRDLPGVAFAQKNWIYTLQQVESDDPYYRNGRLWGMYSDDSPTEIGPPKTTNPYGCQAEKAWAANSIGSRNVCVGLLDDGVQADHPDLAANIWTNPGETGVDSAGREMATNGVDDDFDGFRDDVRGWDFFNSDGKIFKAGTKGSREFHGTHVAGIIGSIGRNGFGVAGVSWLITMIPIKIFGLRITTNDRAIAAIDYLVMLKATKKLNIVGINASWGDYVYDQALLEAIKRAARENILFIAAAGNDCVDNDSIPFYPASYSTRKDTVGQGGTPGVAYDSVISVASIDEYGQIDSFSNYGSETVDLAAPGVNIYSTWPYDTFETKSGTSMAAPHVTGAVALYASTHPSATAEEIKKAILDSVTRTDSLIGKTATGGRLNVGAF
jgi:subtilisin family serine protease